MPHGLARKLTYSDIPESHDGTRYELIRGRLYVTPSPNRAHQLISVRLERALDEYFRLRGLLMLHAPIDVILTDQDTFVPDIVVIDPVADDSKRGVERPPLLAVEILSRSTRSRDLGLKHRRYAQVGVRHYWIADPKERTLTCLKLHGKRYVVRVAAISDGILRHPDFKAMKIDVGLIWPKPASPVS